VWYDTLKTTSVKLQVQIHGKEFVAKQRD
jgi:hypothetical protein